MDSEVKYPHISEILSETMPQDRKDSLEKWRERVGVEEAERLSEAGKNRGNTFDTQIENFISTGMSGDTYVDNYLKKFTDFKLHEHSVENDEFRYRGRMDCAVGYKGNELIVDWKTSNKTKKRSWLHDNPLQLSAYNQCLYEPYDTGLIVTKVGNQFQEFFFSKQQMDHFFSLFLIRLKDYRITKGLD